MNGEKCPKEYVKNKRSIVPKEVKNLNSTWARKNKGKYKEESTKMVYIKRG